MGIIISVFLLGTIMVDKVKFIGHNQITLYFLEEWKLQAILVWPPKQLLTQSQGPG